MRFYRAVNRNGFRLLARTDAKYHDLTAANSSVTSIRDLALAADISGRSLDDTAMNLLEDAPVVSLVEFDDEITTPIAAEEVWAAGVTYRISEEAREAESGMPEIYLDVYEGDRPELFLKSTPSRTVGPDDTVGIRRDSEWNVPEPELGVVLYRGNIVGYTVGNDMSSRSIEGQNPLYLPQAKVYDRCCAIGPCVASPETVGDPHNLEIRMKINRDGELVYDEATSTAKMVRTCEELVSALNRHNCIPQSAVLLTGTSLVPSESFTLQEGDCVSIDIDRIGRLENTVTTV
ncbi:fumarylacetoacetate hydrolase family protein [Halobacteria archaeon AArc-curdl1]|uniref:Fumarylacetoacetate hydrolase family protein n=1 Tax=Natronosalvus hydrolyticus TaxID=2979988 RepID=A0AAP2ZAH3_9EURY|nr:fumarylacetoacetate hydrolase family protein [Halobacteria archaeon AArc-curdl1]